MKAIRIVTALAVFSIILLAAAAAYAMPGDSGTVYGQATMQPTVSISLGGAGASSFDPLVYVGRPGQSVWEQDERELVVTNTGDIPVDLTLEWGSDPSDGFDTWTLGDSNGSNACVWSLIRAGYEGTNVPSSSGGPRYLGGLDHGDSTWVGSQFTFPTDFTNTNTHSMTAIISASEPI